MSDVICPGCGGELRSVAASDPPISVQACLACGGVWLDNETGRRVLGGDATRAALAVGDIVEEQAQGTGASRSYRERAIERACPVCRTPLSPIVTDADRHGVGGVQLDVCAAHGTWFEAHELHTLADGVLSSRRAHDEAVRRATAAKAAADAADAAEFAAAVRPASSDVAHGLGAVLEVASVVAPNRHRGFWIERRTLFGR